MHTDTPDDPHPWRAHAALTLHRHGELDASRRLSAEAVVEAEASGDPLLLGVALRVSGLIAGRERGLPQLERSVRVLEHAGIAEEHARSLIELGRALRRLGRRVEARAALTTGLAEAERQDLSQLAELARAELAAAGGRPRSVIRDGAEALTPSERRVCELAAAGASNPQIARTLFVSRATVESHLHSAYRKLDIGSRTHLATALAA